VVELDILLSFLATFVDDQLPAARHTSRIVVRRHLVMMTCEKQFEDAFFPLHSH
jgi:hypothetical protein